MRKRLFPLFLALVVGITGIAPSMRVNAETYSTTEVFGEEEYDGFNRLGFTADELYDDGLLIAEDDKFIYFNREEDDCLCAENKETGKVTKLADFTAANINVANDVLFFTDMSGSFTTGSTNNTGVCEHRYGGKMYKVENLSNLENGVNLRQIGNSDMSYYNLKYDENGFFALAMYSDDTTEYLKLDEEGEEAGYLGVDYGETIVNAIELNGWLYLEVMTDNDEGETYEGFILCIDRDNGSGRKTSIGGMYMHQVSGCVVFQSTKDGYLYAINPGEDQAYVISYYAVQNFYVAVDNIVCMGVKPNGFPVNFMINKDYWLTPYRHTWTVPVNGWKNAIEVYTNSRITDTPTIPPSDDTTITPEPSDHPLDGDVITEYLPPEFERGGIGITTIYDGPGEDPIPIPGDKITRTPNPWANYKPPVLRPSEHDPIPTSIKPDYPTVEDDKKKTEEKKETGLNTDDAIKEATDITHFIMDMGDKNNFSDYNSKNLQAFSDWYGDGNKQALMGDLKNEIKGAVGGYGLTDSQIDDIVKVVEDVWKKLFSDGIGVKLVEASEDKKTVLVEFTTHKIFLKKFDENKMYALFTGDKWRSEAGISASDDKGTLIYKMFMYAMKYYEFTENRENKATLRVVYDEATKHYRMENSEAEYLIDMIMDPNYTTHISSLTSASSRSGQSSGFFGAGSSGSGGNTSSFNSPTESEPQNQGRLHDEVPEPLGEFEFKRYLLKGMLTANEENKKALRPVYDSHEEGIDRMMKEYGVYARGNLRAHLSSDAYTGLQGTVALLGKDGANDLKKRLLEVRDQMDKNIEGERKRTIDLANGTNTESDGYNEKEFNREKEEKMAPINFLIDQLDQAMNPSPLKNWYKNLTLSDERKRELADNLGDNVHDAVYDLYVEKSKAAHETRVKELAERMPAKIGKAMYTGVRKGFKK